LVVAGVEIMLLVKPSVAVVAVGEGLRKLVAIQLLLLRIMVPMEETHKSNQQMLVIV
jgi:hypothetical protein